MRKLTGHIVNPANDQLKIIVTDEPGQGGANHVYEIQGYDRDKNPSCPLFGKASDVVMKVPSFTVIYFQNGPIKEFGVNGITQEVLLEIVADRLRSFQAGPFSSKENSVALTHIETAQLWLHKRTLDRMARGVEGTNQK